MPKRYIDSDVYTEIIKRLNYVFDNFEKVYLSFSGGKDSGLMLNLTLDVMKSRGETRKLGIMVLDNEANYIQSLEFMYRMMDNYADMLDIYWCCLPISLPCTTSSFQNKWICWDTEKRAAWVRPYPDKPYIIKHEDNRFPFFKEGMWYDAFWDNFGEWYADGKSCASLIGIRADESYNRYRTIINDKKVTHGGHPWTVKKAGELYNCYPLYDWSVEDIWTANARFEYDYNSLYDIFFLAGLTVHKMRVASPFMSESKSSLHMYKAIDHDAWARLCMRVNGANYIATYNKQLVYHDFKLPEGHTWESFVRFLLDTLPDEAADNYRNMIQKSIDYWKKTGRGLEKDIVSVLSADPRFAENGNTSHGSKDKIRIKASEVPDNMDHLPNSNSDVISWKRFAIMILKNDHTGKYIGYVSPFDKSDRKKQLIAKYKNI